MPVTFDKDGTPSYPEWSKDQKDALYGLFQSFDPEQKGLDRAFLKQLNRGVGTNDLQMGLNGLIADGRLESQLRSQPNAKVKVELFTWKAV